MTSRARSDWLEPFELRIGLGCMRLSTDDARDEDRALETISAAVAAGITVFDTARSYGHGANEPGHNERLLVRALRRSGSEQRARIVTKGGMSRAGGGWAPDGRARTIRADCEASLADLDGLPVGIYLLHAPDPRTPWRTSVRALGRLVEDGLVERVGLSNVNRRRLDEALELAPISAVEVALSPYDDRALRGGVVDRCVEAGIALIAHSPLGGPRRGPRLAGRAELAEIAAGYEATPAEVALAWLLGLSADLVAIPGARRPETARSAARAARLELAAGERRRLERAFGRRRARGRPRARGAVDSDSEVVLVMGIPGAGKTRVAEQYVARGYERLNRDERGGSLRALSDALDETLATGTRRVVLDNTYLTRASRSHVLETARRHRVPTRCVWLDTALGQAQVNLVERLLDRFGSLPEGDELRRLARSEQGVLAPTSQMRALRELEPPSQEEGFAAVEQVAFERAPRTDAEGAAVFVAASAVVGRSGWEEALGGGDSSAPHLVFDWSQVGANDRLVAAVALVVARVAGPVGSALCPHPGGPPTCWCRPPLPGLFLTFAREHGIDPSRSLVVGSSPVHRTLATALGARYAAV